MLVRSLGMKSEKGWLMTYSPFFATALLVASVKQTAGHEMVPCAVLLSRLSNERRVLRNTTGNRVKYCSVHSR